MVKDCSNIWSAHINLLLDFPPAFVNHLLPLQCLFGVFHWKF